MDKMEHFQTVSETILLQRLSYDCMKLNGNLKSSLKKAVLPTILFENEHFEQKSTHSYFN